MLLISLLRGVFQRLGLDMEAAREEVEVKAALPAIAVMPIRQGADTQIEAHLMDTTAHLIQTGQEAEEALGALVLDLMAGPTEYMAQATLLQVDTEVLAVVADQEVTVEPPKTAILPQMKPSTWEAVEVRAVEVEVVMVMNVFNHQ
jgi:hypothetical protein